jgi:undecaprenyl-diphosphatase
VLALFFPFLAPALALLAVAIGASRVVLGLHFPSDVWAGAALGTLIGAGAYAWVH